MSRPTPLLEVHDLSVRFFRKALGGGAPEPFLAVAGASLDVARGEVLAIVGESGSGKSTLARAIVQMTPLAGGNVALDGVSLTALWQRRFGQFRPSPKMAPHRRRLQMVFQDSTASLDPMQRVGDAVLEALQVQNRAPKAEQARVVAELFAEVGLDRALLGRHPGALSGGQKQRVNIARALACAPAVLVADEPTSALDVSVKGQVLHMLEGLTRSRGLALLFISHDLPAVRTIAQRVLVMYAGRIVESGPTAMLFDGPSHPYTQALLAAAPSMNPAVQRGRLRSIPRAAAPVAQANTGCPYAPRCPWRFEYCETHVPPLLETDPGRRVACHRVNLTPLVSAHS